MSQCHGTARYARRCKRTARPGELTCGLHADQDVTALVQIRKEADTAALIERLMRETGTDLS